MKVQTCGYFFCYTAIYNMLSTGEVWNPCDLFKIDMPDELKAKQEEKAIKQAVKFLKKTRLCCKLTTSCFLPCKYILLQGLFVMDIFLCFQFLILSRY